MADDADLDQQLTRLSGLGEEQRRALYVVVLSHGEAVSREEAAAAVAISRPLAAYHLDRLVDDGLLEVRFERRTGRSGPGAGRPAKLYQRSSRPVELNVPARDYAFIADLLATAVENDASGAARAAAHQAAREVGASVVAQSGGDGSFLPTDRLDQLRRALASRGYEPYTDTDGALRLRNCPFDRLAADHRELVCRASLAFIVGMVEQLGALEQLPPRLDPRPGECCVAIAHAEAATS